MNTPLKFIGIGSAFNTALGNTSAFLVCGDTFVLFDCGENIFERVQRGGLIDGHKEVKVFITHNHPDHIGSLGTLIFFCYFLKGLKAEIYGTKSLVEILTLSGVKPEFYTFVDIFETPEVPTYTIKPVLGGQTYRISPIQTKHYPILTSVGYYVKEEATGVSFYYSGDSREIPEIIRNAFLEGKITYLYQDTCWLDYDDNAHLSYKKLCAAIDKRREFVYIMHTDPNFNYEKAIHDGFKIAGKK